MMKVHELIEKLQQMDPEDEVHFAYHYGDHWRTLVAPKVERVDEDYVRYSEYHSMPAIVEDVGEMDGDDVEGVVVLR
jgi:hypothetical protein